MDAVELFEQLGTLSDVRWKSASGYVARIDRLEGPLLHILVELPLCGTWIPDRMERNAFLTAYKPFRSSRRR